LADYRRIQARNGIGTITASAIYYRIDIGYDGSGFVAGAGSIERLETTGTGGTGHFFGHLLATNDIGASGSSFAEAIHVRGDLSATIRADDDMFKEVLVDGDFNPNTTAFPDGRAIRVVGDLTAGSTIRVKGDVGPGALVLFEGDIKAGASFIVDGNLDTIDNATTPDVTINGTMAGSIIVGGQLRDKIDINTANGLTGQIILNASTRLPPPGRRPTP
jgi:hypothetical protein